MSPVLALVIAASRARFPENGIIEGSHPTMSPNWMMGETGNPYASYYSKSTMVSGIFPDKTMQWQNGRSLMKFDEVLAPRMIRTCFGSLNLCAWAGIPSSLHLQNHMLLPLVLAGGGAIWQTAEFIPRVWVTTLTESGRFNQQNQQTMKHAMVGVSIQLPIHGCRSWSSWYLWYLYLHCVMNSRYPDAPCMEYLPTFTPKITQM